MATVTGGTAAATSLTALMYQGALAMADVAAISNAIQTDRVNVYPNNPTAALNPLPTVAQQGGVPSGFTQAGFLTIPNRGILRVLPGDYVMVDAVSGWPILVSRTAIGVAGTAWSHT